MSARELGAIGATIRWALTLWLAWRVWQGARWPIVVFLIAQALADEAVGEVLRRLRARHAGHDAAIADLRARPARLEGATADLRARVDALHQAVTTLRLEVALGRGPRAVPNRPPR